MHNLTLIKLAYVIIPNILVLLAIHYNWYRKFFFLPNKFILWLQAKSLQKHKAVKLLEKDSVFIPSEITPSEEFYLTNGDYQQNYEKRNTELPDEILQEKIDCIKNYYNEIWESNEINSIVLKSTGKGIVKSLIKVYSFEAIKRNINKLNKNLSSQNNYQFNGDKLGVYSYEKKNGKLELGLYKTDHFTWLVFKEIYRENKALFDELIFLLNKYNQKSEKFKYIFKCLKYLFSSFGVDICIHGYDSNKTYNFLLCARSGKVEEMKNGLIHVPVNETFSITDDLHGKDKNKYCLYSCVKRGIEEEIGYPSDEVSNENIEFHDFAIETYNGEIGVSALYTIPKNITIEQLQIYPGQDKYLEMDELIAVPFPKTINPIKLGRLVTSERQIKDYVYNASKMDIVSHKWLNFAHLVVQRSILRQLKLSLKGEYLIAAIVNISLLLGFLVYYYYEIGIIKISAENSFSILSLKMIQINGLYSNSIILMLKEFGWWFLAAICTDIGISITIHILKEKKNGKRRFKSFKPILPQWHGDVKVLQATGFEKTDKDANTNLGLNFILSDQSLTEEKSDELKLNLSDFRLVQDPYCSIRKENNQTEYPVSYFPISTKLDIFHKQLLILSYKIQKHNISKFKIQLNITYKVSQNEIDIINYSFAENLKDLKINFNSNFNSSNPFFKKCSAQHKNQYQNTRLGKLEIDSEHYRLHDLLEYHGDFYWTANCELKNEQNSEKIQINKKQNVLYDKFLEVLKKHQQDISQGEHVKTFTLEGEACDLERALNQFLSHNANFSRIKPYEIMGLQLMLVRKNILIADIKY